MKIKIDNQYLAFLLIEILFEKGLVNKATYINVRKQLNLHISQNPLPPIKI